MWHRGRWEHLEYQRGRKRYQQFLSSLFSWQEVCLNFLGTRETVDLGNWVFFQSLLKPPKVPNQKLLTQQTFLWYNFSSIALQNKNYYNAHLKA